ncbi:hypothetical protein U2F10_30955 [Leptothoe sp. EHU-05/26/07-4]
MYADFMALINEIESQFPVNDWKINDIYIWPIFRFNLFFLNASLRRTKTKTTSQHKTLIQKNKKILDNFSGFIQDFRVLQLDRSKNDEFRNVDFVFLSQTNNRNSKIDSCWYDRVSDPYITIAEKLGISSLLLECSPSHEYRLPRYNRSVFIQKDINLCKVRSKLFCKKSILDKISNFEKFGLFKDYLQHNQLINFPTNEQLSYQLISIQNMSAYFVRIFKKIEPVVGFSVPYYWDIAMAFNLACQKQGVKSVDIQHGLQNDSHVAYAKWTTIPTEGYELLPSYFLCWSDFEVELISQWRKKETQNHQPIAIGNLGLELWSNEQEKIVQDVDRQIWDLIRADASLVEPVINVLFTMQPIDEPLPAWIIESIQQSPKHWKWWMRLHPSMLSQYELINELLHQNHIGHVNLKHTTELPLPALLANMDVHVTPLSSVVLEAERCNVPSVMTDVRATQVFPDQIQSKMAVLATTPQKLIDAITEQSLRRKQLKLSQSKDRESVLEDAKKILVDLKNQ